jgi:hypothetical protein
MNRPNERSRELLHRLTIAVLSMALWTVQSGGAAQPGARVQGDWAGTLVVKGRPMSVELTIGDLQSGAAGTRLIYGVPRSCTLNAEYSGEGGANEYFSFTESNGGFCDRLHDGQLWVDLADDRTLRFNVASESGQISESGTLLRVGAQAGDAIDPRVTGQWAGQLSVRGRPVRIELTIPQGRIGSAGTELYYGAPRSCKLSAEFAGSLQDRYAFAFRSADGGFCDRLVFGLMNAVPGDDGSLSITVSSQQSEVEEAATLSKAR